MTASLKLQGELLVEARATAQALLDELELGAAPIMNSLMKAKRLARIMRDADAQEWLELEARGYPQKFVFSRLGSCLRYARTGGRITPDDRYYFMSLPQCEAEVASGHATLEGIRFPSTIAPSVSSSNPNELTGIYLANAVGKLTEAYQSSLAHTKKALSQNVLMFNGLKSALHSYAADCYCALSLSDAATSLFESSRAKVDNFVRNNAPKAADQLTAAFQRFESGDPEALSHALTSCRRLLQTVADAVFPPQPAPFVDSRGKERKVGAEEYKNRLMAFFDRRLAGDSSKAIIEAELGHLAERVDALYNKVCKGVHADVGVDEVRLVLLSTYVFLGEVVRVVESDGSVAVPASRTSDAVDADSPEQSGVAAAEG